MKTLIVYDENTGNVTFTQSINDEEDVEYMEEHNLKNVNEYIKYVMLNDKNSIFNLQEVEGYHIKYYTVKINY